MNKYCRWCLMVKTSTKRSLFLRYATFQGSARGSSFPTTKMHLLLASSPSTLASSRDLLPPSHLLFLPPSNLPPTPPTRKLLHSTGRRVDAEGQGLSHEAANGSPTLLLHLVTNRRFAEERQGRREVEKMAQAEVKTGVARGGILFVRSWGHGGMLWVEVLCCVWLPRKPALARCLPKNFGSLPTLLPNLLPLWPKDRQECETPSSNELEFSSSHSLSSPFPSSSPSLPFLPLYPFPTPRKHTLNRNQNTFEIHTDFFEHPEPELGLQACLKGYNLATWLMSWFLVKCLQTCVHFPCVKSLPAVPLSSQY